MRKEVEKKGKKKKKNQDQPSLRYRNAPVIALSPPGGRKSIVEVQRGVKKKRRVAERGSGSRAAGCQSRSIGSQFVVTGIGVGRVFFYSFILLFFDFNLNLNLNFELC